MHKYCNKLDKKYLKISTYVIFTVAASYLAISFFAGFNTVKGVVGGAAGWVLSLVLPMIIGAIIAYLFLPVTGFIEKMLRKSRKLREMKKGTHYLAAVLTLAVIAVLFILIIASLTVGLTRQLSSLKDINLMEVVNGAKSQIIHFQEDLKNLMIKLGLPESAYDSLEKTVQKALNSTDHTSAVNGILGFVDSFTGIIITIAFSILFFVYFLIDMPMIAKYWGHAFQALLPDKVYRGLKSLVDDIREVFSNYIRGEMTDGLVIGIIMSVALSLAGVRYSVLIGVVTGIGNLIPYMGPILGYIMTILSGILSGDFKAMAIGLVICAVVQVLDGAIINPRLLSNSVEVHAIITTLALIAGSKIGGLFGMVCAIPSAALLKIWFERLVTKMEKKKGLTAEETESAGNPE